MKIDKDIYTGKYTIDSKGVVVNLKTNRKIKLINDGGGYMQVSFSVPKALNRSCRLSRKVHRLVWLNHAGDIPEGFFINHKDGDKKNNCITNLELVTASANCMHSREKLGVTNSKKLTCQQVSEILNLRDKGETVKNICSKYPISYKGVYNILNGVTYKGCING